MRIQARLFLGTALLVLALMGVQWWLHVQQLRALEQQLATVATSVSEGLLTGEVHPVVNRFFTATTSGGDAGDAHQMFWVSNIETECEVRTSGEGDGPENKETSPDVHVVVVPAATHDQGENARAPHQPSACDGATKVVANALVTSNGPAQLAHVVTLQQPSMAAPASQDDSQAGSQHSEQKTVIRQIDLRVVPGEADEEKLLVVRSDGGLESRIPIPVAGSVNVLRSTLRHGIGISVGLLALGLLASAVMARRVARPLQDLAGRAEALGRGELGAQVAETAGGEVGELQRSFNRMSGQLAELEQERERWRQREHLVQLGDLSRGLAHTLRNPLNTLGLAVEELAGTNPERQELVAAARAQIRRVDRWLRSFLALGAGDAAAASVLDLGEILRSAVLEAVQQGAAVELEIGVEEVPVEVVDTALRAAVANLLENAAEVSPPGSSVVVTLERRASEAVLCIVDHGPGVPEEVRQRLFSPHVTTKVEGSGMGLFLARQLIVELHGGSLELRDAEHGGTVAEVRLPLHLMPDDEEPQ